MNYIAQNLTKIAGSGSVVNIKKLSIAISVVLLLLPATLSAGPVIDRIRANNELVLGTPGDFPPFSVTSVHGDLIGFDISLVRELARNMDVDLRVERIPFAGLIPALQAGEVDIIMAGMSMSATRNMEIAFVGPYGNSGQAFIGKDEVVQSLTEPLDLNRQGLRVGVLRDTTADFTVRTVLPRTEAVYTESLDQAMILLLNGAIDGVLSDYPYCKVAEYRYRDEGIEVYEKILSFEQLGMGVSPEDTLFINLLDNYLTLMTSSGALEAMQEYWFKNRSWVKDTPDLMMFRDF
jgi:polar amino acid transport system substrate-binding protein